MILAIGQEDGNGLENICFAPLSSEFRGPVTTSDCVVQSLWGYFRDDVSLFEEEEEDSQGFIVSCFFLYRVGQNWVLMGFNWF